MFCMAQVEKHQQHERAAEFEEWLRGRDEPMVIDAREFEEAKNDPRVEAFAQAAAEYWERVRPRD